MIALMLAAQFGCAKHSRKTQILPTAESVFAAYEQATTSEESKDVQLLNLHTVATVEMALMPEPFQVDSWIIHDKGSQTSITIPGMGEIIEAYNLEHAWTIDPTSGDRLLEGEDFNYAAREFNRAFMDDYSVLYTDAELVGADEFEDQKVWKIVAKDTLTDGKVTLFFTQDESLLVGEHRTLKKSKGSMKVKISYGGYQWIDAGYTPMEMTIKTMGVKQNFVMTDVSINSAETPDIVIPESIQAFIDENSGVEGVPEQDNTTEPEMEPEKESAPE